MRMCVLCTYAGSYACMYWCMYAGKDAGMDGSTDGRRDVYSFVKEQSNARVVRQLSELGHVGNHSKASSLMPKQWLQSVKDGLPASCQCEAVVPTCQVSSPSCCDCGPS